MIGANAVNRHVRDKIDSRVHPTLKAKADALERYAASQGIVFGYPDFAGFRSQADTTNLIKWRDEAVAKGGAAAYYPVAPYGAGYHPKGAAFDIKVVSVPKGKTIAWGYATLGAHAPKLGLTWGGTFGGKQKDIFHFQLAITLAAATQLYAAFQSAQHLNPSVPLGTSPPKLNTAPLVAAVDAVQRNQGAAALVVVALIALVSSGFFLVTVSVSCRFTAP